MKLAILIAAILLPRLSIMACARARQTLTIYCAWRSKVRERDINVGRRVRRRAIHVACLGERGKTRYTRAFVYAYGAAYVCCMDGPIQKISRAASLLWVLQHPAQIQTPTKSRDRRRRRHSHRHRLGHGSGPHMYMARNSDTAKDTKADADRYTPAQR